MAVYGPATGNYSAASIKAAKKNNNAKAGDQIINGKFVDNTGSSGLSKSSKPSDSQGSMVLAVQKAFEAKNKALQDNMTTQLGEIKQSSDDNRSNAYVNSRLSAIGNNEQLANQGLAGELYGSPMSGKSESSRIQENIALGNNINAINRQQTSMENEAKNAVSTQLADNQLLMAQTIAQLRQQERENARQDLADQKAEYANTIGAYGQDYQAEINRLKALGYTDDSYEVKMLNQARQAKLTSIAQAQAEAEQQEFENQLKLANYNLNAAKTNYQINKPYYKPSSGKSPNGSTKPYKPSITAAQAKEALTAGKDGKRIINDNTVQAYNYYYGTNYQARGGQLVNERRAGVFDQLDQLASTADNNYFTMYVTTMIRGGKMTQSDYEAWLKSK